MAHIEQERAVEIGQIKARLREMESMVYEHRTPAGLLQACVTGKGKGPERVPAKGWKPFPLHGRWGGFDQTTWFRTRFTVTKAMTGQRVVALLRPGGEALCYVDGVPAHGIDENHQEVLLVSRAKAGQRFEMVLEAVPSVRFDEYHYFEFADLAVKRMDVWDFCWDCRVALEVLEQLDPNSSPRRQLLDLLVASIAMVDLRQIGEKAFFDSLPKARRHLRRGLKRFAMSQGIGELTLTGQSHIDTAWLWPLRETHRKCGRTFSTVLSLLDQYPEFMFMCSQAVQYEWVKKDYPELYRRIKRLVKAGRWEPIGGMWVESDCNVPCGEALVRQLLYGNRFFRREFGLHSRTAWLPDSFGYSWALPQILKKAQIDTFVTTKISWSRFSEFPYSLFQWEGTDGSRVRGLMPPLNYNGMMTVRDAIAQWTLFHQKDKVSELPYPIGYGDGGGGPTMEMIERGSRLSNIVGVPKCRFGRLQDSVDRMAGQCPLGDLPVWNGELYLELHRGCQTSQARTKRQNRKCEALLRDAEFLSSLAMLNGAKYPQREIEDAWKTVLTNQFHDILPGSSITEVYQDTERDYGRARAQAGEVLEKARDFLAARINTSGKGTPVLVFNTLSWTRSGAFEVDAKLPGRAFHIVDDKGQSVPFQRIGEDRLLILANHVPSLGYAVYRILPGDMPAAGDSELRADTRTIENAFLRVRLDRDGRLMSVYDKEHRREVLDRGKRGNVLQLFEDRPAGNDAWDIDHNFEEIGWEPGPAQSVEVIETGPVRVAVRFIRKTGRSTITQDIVLHAQSRCLDFVTHVDWHERHVLLKTAFPVGVRAANATYEIQYGAIERATHRNTAYDRGRFEVPAQRWADISEGDYGVSLLNDCKYGYDVHDNVLRLSLLRSPQEPDPVADQGEHWFTYSLHPHQWDWRNGTTRRAAELNTPLLGRAAPSSNGQLPPAGSLISVDSPHVVVDAIKKGEDTDALIVRCYEAYGQRGAVTLSFGIKPRRVYECDLMEENEVPCKLPGSDLVFSVTPFDLRTFTIEF